MNYQKITKNHPSFEMVEVLKSKGLFFCDSVNHNYERGCSNPNCWKYNPNPKQLTPIMRNVK